MDDKYIKDIYDNLGSESVFGDYNDYYSLITSDESYIKDIYDNLGGESVFGLYDDFVALVKKKDELQPTSQEGDTVSTIKEKTTPTSLESSENKFDYRDFLLKKEEEAKPFLEEALKGRDFSVEETGIGNALNVKDNITGETIEIDLRPAPITGNTMEQQYEKLDKLFSPEYEKKRRSVDYNKLLEESGYIEANNRDGFYMSVDFEDKKRDQHRFQNENGETIVKKAKDLSPELLTAINLYEEANKKRNTSIYAGNVDVNTRKDDEVIGSDDVPDEYLFSVGIDKDDYLKWVNKNRRKESVLYKAVKYLFKGDEEEEYFKEKTQYEKIKSYKASILNDISSDISVIDSRIKLSKDQSLKNNLKREREILQKEFLKNANQMSSAINLFPKYKEYTLDKDLERRKNLYYASRSGEKINATAQGIELGKTGFSAIHNFATGFLSIAGEMPDELLFKAGFEDKGFFKGLSEVFTDASESMDASFGPVQRRTVAEGKTVFYKNQEYIVGKNGSVLDSKTNVSVKGIISDEDIKEIIKRSKNIKDTDLNLTVGSGLQGTTQTLANLVALIRTGGKTTKALGLKGSKAGAYGMGIASYMSSVTSSVEDIRSQLVESGMSEQEALDVSISAGNAIASLDGIFSGLAGSNAKLMSGLSGIKQEIINAAKTKGKEFSSKQLKDKAYELLKENAKELFIEELPVLFSEKGINYLVNEHIGKEVLDDDINRGDIVETAILTIAATSTLGSINLLSGNNRKDFIRGLAKDNNINLEATLNKMVLDEQITKEQAYEVYKEVSSMRDADLKTSETIFMSENIEEAADLIKQKELLQEKAKDLDGALKEDVDKKIASIDEQLKELREKDKESAKKELDAIQKQETRDIPNAQPAEGIQEMETEVQEPSIEKETLITPETSSNYANLTEDDKGNFVFYHVGSEGYSQIKPRSGATKATSGEERAALSKVGGMAMYYTKASDGESMVSGSTKYEVKIPKDKVYDFNSDPLNLKKEAKQRHDAENPGKGYDDNSELAYVAKIAEEKGFDMVIAEWDGKTRAQTTKALAPNDTQVMEGNTVVKPFKNQYKSNADKGFVSVIPESKQSKLKALYNKIYKERNKQNKYDDLYRLQENSVKMSQEEITDLIEGSDISQEIKNEYKQILESKEGKRKSAKKMDEYASSEVDRVKKLPLEAEDGATMNLDGSKYEGGGLVIPVASTNMNIEDLSVDAIQKMIDDNSESIGGERVKVGIYKFPDQKTASVDINIIADPSKRELALEIGRELGQESLFDLDTFENVKTGADGKNPKKVTPKEFLEIQRRLSDNVSKLREKFGKKGEGSITVNTPAKKVTIEDQAIKAKQAISKLFPNVDIEVYYNENDYHKAIGEVDQSGGTYFNNKVYINLTRATDTTVAHEVFHAVLSQSLKSDAEIQNLTKKFVDSLINGNDKDVIQALSDKVATIEQYKDVANEEVMAELFGVLAGFGKKLKPKTRSLVKRFLDRVAKILGLKKFTDNELIDVLNTLSKKVALGESIEAGDIGIFKGGKVVDNPSQAISKKSVGLFDVQYTEDNRRNELIDKGLLVEVNDVSGFSGLQATITSPDDMLAGTISIDGKQIFEGGGGIFFVTKYGDVWASGKKGTANTLAKMINDSLKNNGDRGLLVLAKGADQKLISSVSGVNSSLAILDVMLDKGLISPSDFRSAVSGAVKAAGGIISLSGSAKQLKSDINKYFSDPNTTTFEKRGNVVKDLIGRLAQSKSVKDNSTEIIELLGGDPNKNLAKGSTKLSQSLGDLVAGVAAEQLTKGLSVGDVYGIIEVNSEVEVIEDSHPSYPFHIRLKDGSSPKLILPKNRQNGSEVLKTSTGKVYRVGNVSVLSGSFNPDIKSKKQVSGRPSIDEVRKFAKENNIPEADTNAYLKELGYTNKEIAGGGITSTDIRERSESSIKAKKKKDASIATKTREKLLDRQARIKGLLKGIDSKESKQAVAKIVTKAGATGYASFRFKEAEDKIYKGLSNEDSKILDEMIYESRIISINKNRADRGMDPYTGIEGYNEVSAQRDLDDKKQKLGDKKFKELKKRSDIYFTEFNKSLKRMFDSGLISEEVYNQLKDLDYSPIKTIKYIIPENSSSEEIDRVAISAGVTKDAIKNLGDSNVNDIITDTKWLLATNLSMIEAKIFENRMLNAFEDAINSATETEKIALNEYILDNPVVGKYKDGRPKRKYDDKYDNINYTKVYYKKDGVDKYFVMKKIYAEQLLDVKMKQSKTSDVISKLTGTQVLRFFATSGNPLFIVGNTAVDFNNILFLSDTYSNFKLLGGAELAYDFVSNSLGKVFASESYKKSYNEFMEHGGSIDYLSVDGLKALQNLDTGMKPIQKATDILKSYGKVLSYLGETSEISFRIAVYEKSKSNQLKKLGRKPTDQEMEDIMFEAAREARETIDFSQGGSATKAADKTLPYLNAATQGLRKGLDYANNNPGGFASSMLQAALMSGGLMAGSLLMLLSGLDDEDEIDEVLGRVSEYEKSNYHIIFTGNKDKDGEYEYYRVKKLPTISVFSTFAEQLVTKSVLKSRGIDYDIDGDVMEKSLKSAMPIIPTPKEFLQRNPLLSSVVTYATNYDFFYDKPIFQGPRGKNIAPSAEGLYDPKVNQIYKDWGQATGMSPARSKAALEKIITSESTNPVVGLIYSGYDAAFKDDTAISEDFNKAKESLFKNISKKVRRKTNKNLKVYKERADIEEQEMIFETEIYNKEQKVYRQIVSKHKNNEELTNNELKNIVKENFDKKDWKRYYRKYYIMNKKKDVDRGLLDILYENTPEVQALKLFKRFGNSLDAEEYKELRKVSKAARRNLSKKAYKIYKDKYTK